MIVSVARVRFLLYVSQVTIKVRDMILARRIRGERA